MMKKAAPVKPCGFCNDSGSHALLIFSSPENPTAVCSDCIKIFYKRVEQLEKEYAPRYSDVRN